MIPMSVWSDKARFFLDGIPIARFFLNDVIVARSVSSRLSRRHRRAALRRTTDARSYRIALHSSNFANATCAATTIQPTLQSFIHIVGIVLFSNRTNLRSQTSLNSQEQ
jgi:hypothetical protein